MSRNRVGGLSVVLLNARSIRNKMLEFRAMVATSRYDLIAITETWLDTAVRDFAGEYHLPGYSLFHRDRQGRVGGGVLLYARSHLLAVVVQTDSHHELVCAEIRGCVPRLQVLVVYRPPHYPRDSDTALYEDLSNIIQDKTTLVVGDFNCHVDWASYATGAEGQRLVEFSDNNFLAQMVSVPTRGRNTLDLVFTTDEDLISGLEVGPGLAGSDHGMVSFDVLVGSEGERYSSGRRLNLRRANYPRFTAALQALAIHPLDGTVEDMWSELKSQYLQIQTRCIPYKSFGGSAKAKPSWLTPEIVEGIGERKLLYRASLADPSARAQALLAQQRRHVKRLVRRAKASEENRVALSAKDNPKEFFAYVNRHKVRKTLGPLQTAAGDLVTGDAALARVFNEYFCSVFTVEDVDRPVPVISYDGGEPLEEIRISEQAVLEKLTHLDPHKAPGPDGFLPKVMKSVAAGLAPHLCGLFEHSLARSEVPLDMRSADVCPIHKKGPEDQASNFRPISLTSVPGKVLESFVKDAVVAHLEQNDLLLGSQHGFRAGRSCLTSLLDFYHNIFGAYDQSGRVDVIFLDFRKAFDKVPHRRLMSKVRALGIGGSVASWIEAWLGNRRQRVVVNSVPSGWADGTNGVPRDLF